jgi:ubiquinone/menaquinone biosynthesis C-methylase UbiE
MSTENIYAAVLRLTEKRGTTHPFRKHLDVGAGTGGLIRLVRERFKAESAACDYTDQLMKLPGQRVDIANLNTQPLPYTANSFDLVTATEVIEHLEHYRETLRELFRVLEPGGMCVLTTPNILNLNSRLRFLWFGYWNLFGPLPVKNGALYSTGGHINPVSYFYIAHALMDAGFEQVAWTVDKPQRSAMPKLALLYPFIRLFGALAYRREVTRYHTVDNQNAPFVRAMNHPDMLLGRTIVVSAVKPNGQ